MHNKLRGKKTRRGNETEHQKKKKNLKTFSVLMWYLMDGEKKCNISLSTPPLTSTFYKYSKGGGTLNLLSFKIKMHFFAILRKVSILFLPPPLFFARSSFIFLAMIHSPVPFIP